LQLFIDTKIDWQLIGFWGARAVSSAEKLAHVWPQKAAEKGYVFIDN